MRSSFVISCLSLGSLCGALGCSAKPGTPEGSGGGTGSTGCDNIDYASYATAAPVSFSKDVMPIFGQSCTTSDCHNSHDKKAHLDLGFRCHFDSTTRLCTFPADAAAAAVLDPMMTQTVPWAPLTPAIITATLASLLSPALTVLSPTVQRVIPGDPEHSFLIQKVAGTQDGAGYMCKSQDTSHHVTDDPCGDTMPLGQTILCADRAKFGLLAAWIAQGAPNN